MSETTERWCWHCGDRKALPSQILCEPCLDEAGDLLGEVVVDHVKSLVALKAELAAKQGEIEQLRAALVKLDSYLDFSLHWEPGPDGGANFENVEGVNEALDEAYAALNPTPATEQEMLSWRTTSQKWFDKCKDEEAEVARLRAALEHSTWMNRWQFDEHRTRGYGKLEADNFCRCDWCKTYRDTRNDDTALLAPTKQEDGDALQKSKEVKG